MDESDGLGGHYKEKGCEEDEGGGGNEKSEIQGSFATKKKVLYAVEHFFEI